MEWTDRPIRAPQAEYLTQEEFRSLFKLSEEAYDRYRKDNGIPAPIKHTARTLVHPWEHATYFALWLRFGPERDGVKAKD